MVERRTKHVARTEITEPFIVDTTLVQHVVADGPAQQETETETLVGERTRQGEEHVGISVADDLIIGFSDSLRTVEVFVNGSARSVESEEFRSPEVAQRFAFDNPHRVHLQIVGEISGFDFNHFVLIVRESHQFVPVMTDRSSQVPSEVPGRDRRRSDRQFDTRVVDGSHVGEGRGVEIGRHGNAVRIKQVLRAAEVVVQRETQPVVQYARIQSDVELLLALPTQLRIGIAAGLVGTDPFAVVVEVRRAFLENRERTVVADLLIARNAEAGTKFQLVQPVGFAHPRLGGDAPSGADCRKDTPLVVVAEARRSLVADRCR